MLLIPSSTNDVILRRLEYTDSSGVIVSPTDSSVFVTVKDSDGDIVTGESFPKLMPYNVATKSYIVELDSSLDIVLGAAYTVEVSATLTGAESGVRLFTEKVIASLG